LILNYPIVIKIIYMSDNERGFCERHVIPVRNGELLILVYEDRRGDPYLVIKRIKRTKSGRVKEAEGVAVFRSELPAFYDKLLEILPKLGLKVLP